MQLDELVHKFKNKDVKAFEALYQMYHKSVQGIVFNIVRDNEIAEEVAQDVFIKAWNNATSYSAKKGRFFTWIINIARNAAIDKTRSKNFKNNSKNLDAQIFVDILETHDSLDSKTDAIGIRNFVNKLKDKCINKMTSSSRVMASYFHLNEFLKDYLKIQTKATKILKMYEFVKNKYGVKDMKIPIGKNNKSIEIKE